ncbi:MAG: LacI family DNA-binding transcriptional regulator, partial [Dinoroseobacter sp.]|nr:LacI family DNA-binding transcriptional regulator [Dinoroseobacter sp.]
MNEQSVPLQKRVTVIDVAREAGVSPGTVSNAISGKRKVDDATRERIEAAIAKLGYVPNLAARRMRTGRTNTIAIFSSMPLAVAAGTSKLGFLMEIAASAAVTALEYNSALALIPPIEDSARAFETIAMDGAVIVEPEADDPILEQLSRRGVPTVAIGAPDGVSVPSIAFDYRHMANLLVDHLLEVGSQNFPLIVGQSTRKTNTVFAEVYRERASQIEMPARVLEVPERNAEEAARLAMASELDRS